MAQQNTKRFVYCNAEFGVGQRTKSIALSPKGMKITHYKIINETPREGKTFEVVTPAKEKY
jgi:hypothetical protein